MKKNEEHKLFGIIGLGRIGRCIQEGLIQSKFIDAKNILFTTKNKNNSNQELTKKCKTILIAVKPQNIFSVLDEIKNSLTPSHTIISVVAGVSTEQIEKTINKKIPIVRAMPNIAAFVNEAITAICPGQYADAKHLELVKNIFAPLGKVVSVEEKHMDAVTGLSGSGPAYIYVILESLTDAGIKVGLPRDIAIQLACQTVLGSAKMLQVTQKHPAALKDEVTTPAGCTIDGLIELEEGGLRVTLIKAVVKATERAKCLSK